MTVAVGSPDRILLPFRHLRWRSTAVALVAVGAPVCGVTTWLATRGGDLLPALALTVLVAVAAAVMTVRVGRAKILLQDDGLRYWDPRRDDASVARAAVARAVVRSVHSADGRGVRRHLFLLDADDRTAFRMCDRWWTETQVGEVARHFEVPIETLPEPVHLVELRRTVAHQLRWDERHPALTRLAIVVGAAAGCLVVGWLSVAAL